MQFGNVDWLALIVSFVAGYVFSAAWYITLNKPWMAAIGKTEEEVKAGAGPLLYVIAIVGQLIIAYVLMHLIVSLGDVSLSGGLKLAVTLWFGFVLTTCSSTMASSVRPGPTPSSMRVTGWACLRFRESSSGWSPAETKLQTRGECLSRRHQAREHRPIVPVHRLSWPAAQ